MSTQTIDPQELKHAFEQSGMPEERAGAIAGAFRFLEIEMSNRFDAVDQRFDAVDNRLDGIEKALEILLRRQ